MKTIFVDAYNVINSWPELKSMKDNSFEGARQSLIDTLHNYSVFENCRIFIVFDAHKVGGNGEKKEKISKNVFVIFTKDGETADSYIEKKVNEFGRKCEVVVVTSDNLEQQTVFQRGAVRMSSLEFYNDVRDVKSIIETKTKDNSYIRSRNTLSDNLSDDIMEKLEKLRRGN